MVLLITILVSLVLEPKGRNPKYKMLKAYNMITLTDRSSASAMKYFLLLFLVGFAAAASVYDAPRDVAARDLLATSDLLDHLDEIQLASESDEQPEWEKKLREKFELILEKIKDAIEKGENVKEDLLEKAKELIQKLKEAKVRISDKAKELLQKIREKARDLLQKLIDKISGGERKKRIIESIKELFRKLKESLLSKIDADSLKEKIEKIFGKGSDLADQLLEWVKEKGGKGKQKILDFIDRLLEDDKEREERSLGDMWEKIKEYFKDLHLEIKEKFFKFGEWVKEHWGKALENLKTKHDKVREIAKEMITHGKEMSKEILAEGLEFLRPYKEDLGELWDQLKETVKDLISKKE